MEVASSSDSDQQKGIEQEADFYDPDADDADAVWAAKQRQGRETDAILSCPGCLATCCLECQQHDLYPNQYRAMFVMNCRVDTEQVEIVQEQDQGGKKRQRGQAAPTVGGSGQTSAADAYHPVLCALCGTRLGVRDAEEVFHFTCVIASEA